jgi:hypothetical protein
VMPAIGSWEHFASLRSPVSFSICYGGFALPHLVTCWSRLIFPLLKRRHHIDLTGGVDGSFILIVLVSGVFSVSLRSLSSSTTRLSRCSKSIVASIWSSLFTAGGVDGSFITMLASLPSVFFSKFPFPFFFRDYLAYLAYSESIVASIWSSLFTIGGVDGSLILVLAYPHCFMFLVGLKPFFLVCNCWLIL